MNAEPLVFVVDDDPAACASVVAVVEAQGFSAQRFESAEAFLHAYRNQAGCLIADLRMPGMGGLELQEQLVEAGTSLPVILISAYADVPLAVRAMQSGAVTLLEKPYRQEELLNAIEQALERDRQQREHQQRLSELESRMAELTRGERQVLSLLIQGHTNKAIASRLDLGLRTVEKYRHNLFKKLGVQSLPELVRVVIAWEEAAPASVTSRSENVGFRPARA